GASRCDLCRCRRNDERWNALADPAGECASRPALFLEEAPSPLRGRAPPAGRRAARGAPRRRRIRRPVRRLQHLVWGTERAGRANAARAPLPPRDAFVSRPDPAPAGARPDARPSLLPPPVRRRGAGSGARRRVRIRSPSAARMVPARRRLTPRLSPSAGTPWARRGPALAPGPALWRRRGSRRIRIDATVGQDEPRGGDPAGALG